MVLVPVPSRPGGRTVARLRGDGGTRARRCDASARRATRAVAPLLASRGAADQAGLGAGPGAPTWPVDALSLARLARGRPPTVARHVVVCDDVVTTGSTAREAQRALEAVGLPPVATRPSRPPAGGRRGVRWLARGPRRG